ncbi:phosphatase PAP2 family protein [Wenjunlia tyrosinilytica]|nr:phosphatase PAP2 family protein [Wenjunlia tyrosinilytica]
MGAPTADTDDGHEACSSERPVGSVHSDGGTAGTPAAGDRTPRAALVGLRNGLRFPGRPKLWFEVLLIGVAYWVYSLVRNAVPEQKASAMHHADQIWDLERSMGLGLEHWANHVVDSAAWLIVGMNYYYATLHFIVTIGVLVWLFRSHPGRYSPARTVLFATTGIALLGYYLYPLAPPRLMNGGGFIDTVVVHHTWGSMASGDLANVSNQFAAMPSMHIGWSTWCGITLVVLAGRRWVKVLGALYPVATLVVIVATANHFWMDAIGGLICLAAGSGIAYAVHGRWPHRFPRMPLARPAAAVPPAPDPVREEPAGGPASEEPVEEPVGAEPAARRTSLGAGAARSAPDADELQPSGVQL